MLRLWRLVPALLLVLNNVFVVVHSITANPQSIKAKQTDGTKISLQLHGDEWDNFYTDEDGNEVKQNAEKDFVYIEIDSNGVPIETSIKVGEKAPTIKRTSGNKGPIGVSPIPLVPTTKEPDCAVDTCGETDFVGNRRNLGSDPPRRRLATRPPRTHRRAQVTTGLVRNLVVLVRFADHVGRTLPTPSDIDILMNQPGGDPVLADTGSVWDVFHVNSYGAVDLQSTVLPWVTVSGTEAFYANGVAGRSTRTHDLLKEALSLVDPTVDFSTYDTDGNNYIDAITFLHSGYGGEFGGTDAFGAAYEDRIWSHQWEFTSEWSSAEGVQVLNYNINSALWSTSGSEMAHIGVIAHELGM